MGAQTVDRIMREMSKTLAKDFKSIPFVPEITRGRKKGIDDILLNYKRTVDDSLRYLIKNYETDLKVMIKRYSDYDFKPYQEISLRAFGKLPSMNTVTQENTKNDDLIAR